MSDQQSEPNIKCPVCGGPATGHPRDGFTCHNPRCPLNQAQEPAPNPPAEQLADKVMADFAEHDEMVKRHWSPNRSKRDYVIAAILRYSDARIKEMQVSANAVEAENVRLRSNIDELNKAFEERAKAEMALVSDVEATFKKRVEELEKVAELSKQLCDYIDKEGPTSMTWREQTELVEKLQAALSTDSSDGMVTLAPSPDGRWVRYDDYHAELTRLRAELEKAKEELNWQNHRNAGHPTKGGFEFYINEEWTGLADAAIDAEYSWHCALRKHRIDPDDERVRIRRVAEDDTILKENETLRAENEALRKAKAFTPFEVHQVAVFNYQNQSGHPGNWDSFGKFIPRAIDQLRHTQEQITAAMNQGKMYEEKAED